MSLLKWAFFGLLVLPLAELVVFVAVAVKIGFLAAVALTILTSLAGMAIMRSAGRGQIAQARSAFGQGTIRTVALDGPGILTVIGGFLLFIPGFLTDILGALLLLAPTRRLIHAAVRRAATGADTKTGRPEVVDLAPDQWRRVPEKQLPGDRIGHKPSTGPNS